MENIDLAERVVEARKRIQHLIRRTPLDFSPFLTALSKDGPKVYLKLESEQITGALKARGTFNKFCRLLEEDPKIKETGVVTASCGNHALASTFAMKKFGIPVEVYTPTTLSQGKRETLEAYKANIVSYGSDCVDTETKARETAKERGVPFISPYNDLDIVAGHGTIGLEIYEDLPDVDAVFLSVGGGGSISGTGAFLKSRNPNIKVFGCQPEVTKTMYESIKAGRVVFEESGDTLSDGTAGGIEDDTITFELCQKYVDDWILVKEEDIAKALYFVLDKHHKIIEGAAGVAVAAYMSNTERFKEFKNIAIVICGGNITTSKLVQVVRKFSYIL